MFFNADYKADKADWKKFENDAADIFEEFDYKVERDIRLNGIKRFQIDFIAYDRYRCFIIDCKDHFYIAPAQEEIFTKKQEIRANALLKGRPDLRQKKSFVLLITRNKGSSLINHSESSEKIYSVDIESVPELLTNIHLYEEDLFSFLPNYMSDQ